MQLNLNYSLLYSYWKTFLCPKYNSTDVIDSEDCWFNFISASQILIRQISPIWIASRRRKHGWSWRVRSSFFPNSKHWPTLLGTSFVTLWRWRSESKNEICEMKSWFHGCFQSHYKISGRKAQDDLIFFFLKSLGNIKLIWVGSIATSPTFRILPHLEFLPLEADNFNSSTNSDHG